MKVGPSVIRKYLSRERRKRSNEPRHIPISRNSPWRRPVASMNAIWLQPSAAPDHQERYKDNNNGSIYHRAAELLAAK